MSSYIPILLLFLFSVFFVGTIILISTILGGHKKSKTNLEPYECGIDQASVPRQRIDIKFFIIALIFILFDVEVALLFPWAALFRRFVSDGMRTFAIMEGLVFIGILLVGLIYVVRSGALEWAERNNK